MTQEQIILFVSELVQSNIDKIEHETKNIESDKEKMCCIVTIMQTLGLAFLDFGTNAFSDKKGKREFLQYSINQLKDRMRKS